MRVGFAQINTTVGDLGGNTAKILDAYKNCVSMGAELVITPELAITGYPPQDLVFKSQFVPRNLEALERIHASVETCPLIVGFIDRNHDSSGRSFRNSAAVLRKGVPRETVHKSLLPTYDVFDEDRYFQPGETSLPVLIGGRKVGVTICEDIWTERFLPRKLYGCDPVGSLARQGAEIIVNLSASPFHAGKPRLRMEMLSELAARRACEIYYCNAVGGNDQLIFDGNSVAVSSSSISWRV